MADIGEFFASWVQVFVPQPCFDEFFKNFNFFDGPCLKLVISKCLGYAIILGSILVKVPQIIKIAANKSGEGLNMASISLEVFSLCSTFAYGFAQGFPFSSYGEAMFLLLQTSLIATLVLHFRGNTSGAAMYFALLAAFASVLLSGAVPEGVLWLLQASVMPNVVVARMLQAFENFKNGSTGQLSAITVFLLFLGAMARVFTSIQETGDPLVVLIYVVSSTCNCIIASQMLYYWNREKPMKVE